MKMHESTILIVGGTSGIGRALAESFYDLGNTVIVAGRKLDLINEMKLARPKILGLELDLNDKNSLAKLSSSIENRFPDIDVLIANAGIMKPEDLTDDDCDISVAEDIINTNILGVLRTVNAALPVLKQRKSTIIITTSSLAFVPRANFPSYCASKAFLHSWIQSLRYQLRNLGVEVLELAPPYVRTQLTGPHQSEDPRAMPLADFISETMEALMKSESENGEIIIERVRNDRDAELHGRYGEVFNTINPK
ncbi:MULTISPECIES: SDR family oxidoreductase [Pseudomonas]|uniref:SDR family NAD(P)-dependent oxidoreductase n=1 Tax=Pseudomonas koreensis TaxID=198620 RepID=A0A9X3BBF9_9PSED|nr:MULTISPECIES: SDR family NAD(P)-dependent oxidoreductase [Pseudomonas]MBV4473431.1 SDR family NAD(P)-dependent oxidoreductase [Pseudomonas botevensis]MCU7247023.1 SDR family NAD(P)-dependent oxidoreductase [Pseudomonas koreensis]